MEKQKAGRKPLGDKPLTSAEKMRRQRVKQACLALAAKDNGYVSVQVLLNEKQLLAWGELEHKITNGKPTPLTQEKISNWIFYALKNFLNDQALELDLKIPKHDDWPQHCEGLLMIQHNAQLKFNEWEKGLTNDDNHNSK